MSPAFDNKRKRDDDDDVQQQSNNDATITAKEPKSKKLSTIPNNSSSVQVSHPTEFEENKPQVDYSHSLIHSSNQLVDDSSSSIQASKHVTKLCPVQYQSWSKEDVRSLLSTTAENGGAGLTIEDVKPLYDAGFKGTSLANIVTLIQKKDEFFAIEQVKRQFTDAGIVLTVQLGGTLQTVVNWVDNLLKTRLYHLWSTESAKEQLCETVGKGGAGIEQEEFAELEHAMKLNSIRSVLEEYSKKETDLGKKIKKWIDSIQLIVEPSNLLSILDSLVLTPNVSASNYSYCECTIPYVKRSSAFKDYCSYVDDLFTRRDPKESSAATIVFIGDCPGVGKSRFAKELAFELKKQYAEKPFTILDLAIWFSNGFSPTEQEVKDLNRLTIARVIYSYITHVRPHQWPEGSKNPLQIFDLLENCDLTNPTIVFDWIAKRESQLRKTNIWIHFTIDEYNQIFKYLKTDEQIQKWCDYLSEISTIRNESTFFTILLAGTHREAFLNLKSKDSGRPTYLKRINVTNFSQKECEEVYSHLHLPDAILVRSVLASFGGHARLIAMFSNFYAKSEDKNINEILTLLDGKISETGNIQLENNPILAEFLLMLCFTRVPIDRNTQFGGKPLSQYQRSNIIFLKAITGDTKVIVEIPLIIARKMVEQVCDKFGSNHFLSSFGKSWETWLSFGNHFDTFEKLNQILLYVKLCSFQQLYTMGIIDEQINLSLLFSDETLKDYTISLNNVKYSTQTLDYQFPSTKQGVPDIEENTVIKNSAHALFADLFIILPIIYNNTKKKLFCYLQVKHIIRNEILTTTEIENELEKLEKKKDIITKWADMIYVLFLTNRRTADITKIPTGKQFSIIDNTNALQYYGPFAYLIATCPISDLSLKTMSIEDICFWTLTTSKAKAQRIQNDDDLVTALNNNYSIPQLELLYKLDLREKEEINKAILLQTNQLELQHEELQKIQNK